MTIQNPIIACIKDRPGLLLALILVIGTAVLLSQVWCRPIDRDEGFWLGSASLINGGKVLYVDFFMPHMPTAVYVYGGLSAILGNSLVALRLANILFSLFSGLLLYYLWARRGEWGRASLVLFLYTFSYLVINWHMAVKVYALLDLFLLAGFLFLSDATERGGWWRALLAGLFLGLGVFTRSLFLPLLLIAGGYLLWRRRYTSLAWGILGVVLAGVPLLVIAVKSWDYLYFNMAGVHLLSQSGYISFWERFIALKEALFQPDTLILFALSIIALVLVIRRRLPHPMGLAVMFFLSIFFLNLIPISSSLQYQVSVVPYGAILASAVLVRMWQGGRRWLVLGLLAVYALGGLYRPLARIVFDRYHKPEVGVAVVMEVRNYLDRRVEDGDVVITYWGGYVPRGAMPHQDVMMAVFVEHLEKHSGGVESLFSSDELARYHLPDRESVEAIIAGGEGEWVVLGVDAPADLDPAAIGPYKMDETVAGVGIYSRTGEGG